MKVVDRSDLTGTLRGSHRRVLSRIKLLVIHRNTVADSVDGVAAWYASPPPPNEKYRLPLFPYHFFIDENVSQVHSLDTVSPHAGPQGFNGPGVAIALNVNGLTTRPPPAMRENAVRLMAWLMVACPSIERVVRHRDGCPGKMVDVETMAVEAATFARMTPLVAEGVRLNRVWGRQA